MRVLFLDFDGVLNTRQFLQDNFERRRADQESAAYEHPVAWMLDPEKVALLNKIFEATKCLAVISSSWRHYHTRQELQEILDFHEFGGYVLGITSKDTETGERPRGLEIQEWLDAAPQEVTSFVIVDDDDEMVHLKHRLVHTDNVNGLTQEHVDRAIQMLLEECAVPASPPACSDAPTKSS